MKFKVNAIKYIKFVFFVFLVFAGCTGETGPTGPEGEEGLPGPKLKGNLSGFIFLLNVNGENLPPSKLASISIEGTNIIVNCDSTGRWQVDSLETGTYNLIFKMNDFGTYVKKSFQFIGGGDVFYGKVTLGKIPEFFVESMNVIYDFGLQQVVLSGIISAPPPQNQNSFLMIFAGIDTLVSSNPENFLYENNSYTGTTSFTISISVNELLSAGFSRASKVFFRAYGSSYLSYYGGIEGGYYTDPKTGRNVYTSLSLQKSPVVSITLP